MALTPPPTAPDINDPDSFEARAQAWVLWVTTFVAELTTIIGVTIPAGSAAAGTLTGTTMAANVVTSSLTTLGILTALRTFGDAGFGAAAVSFGSDFTSVYIKGASGDKGGAIYIDAGDGTDLAAVAAEKAAGLYTALSVGTLGSYPIRFFINGLANEKARVDTSGNLLVGKTASSQSAAGAEFQAVGHVSVTRSGNICGFFNRLTDDGDIIVFAQATANEGSISISGNTISYNAFLGSHWAQLEDGSRQEILRGTVMETIDLMCEWPGESNERLPKVKVSDTPGSTSVYGVHLGWDNDEFREEQVTELVDHAEDVVELVDGKYVQRRVVRQIEQPVFEEHPLYNEDGSPVMVRVRKAVLRDVADKAGNIIGQEIVEPEQFAPAVHRVPVMRKRQGVNDMHCAGVGAFLCRIAKGVEVKRGDLLESNGDGCARVQADDAIRAATIGKVTAAVIAETYPDGSYLVPCVLMCG